MLDELLPKRAVRIHLSDKKWMTPNIKRKIKAKQKVHPQTKKSTDVYVKNLPHLNQKRKKGTTNEKRKL